MAPGDSGYEALNAEVEASIGEAAEERKIQSAGPQMEDLISEFGKDSYKEVGDEWRVHFRRPDLTQYENDERAKRFKSMYSERVELNRERSLRRDAGIQKVVVRDKRGDVIAIPASREATAGKKGFGAVRSWGRRRKRLSVIRNGKYYRVENGRLIES